MVELKKKIEALLFSSGRKMDIEEISRLCKSNSEDVRNVLNALKKTYEENNSSLMVVDEGNYWKITVREQYLPLVQNIVTQTELSKTLMETLAVIAFKYPIKQSDLIRIRTNKAYDHLKELEEIGYITRQKYGRTKLIKLTQKFFDYFDLPPEKLKEKFETFEGIATAIQEKESEIKKMKEEQKKKLEESKRKEEKMKKAIENEELEIDLIDEKGHKKKLEIYEEQKEKPKIKIIEEKIDGLEIVDEPEETTEEELETEEIEEEPIKKADEELEDEEKVKKLAEDILSEDEEEKKEEPEEQQEEQLEEKSEVDKRVDEILSEKKEELTEEKKEEPRNILEVAEEEGEEKKEKKQKSEDQEQE